jgi:hypothetical protein
MRARADRSSGVRRLAAANGSLLGRVEHGPTPG